MLQEVASVITILAYPFSLFATRKSRPSLNPSPPVPPGNHFTAIDLTPGRTYRTIAAYRDYDGDLHEIGECWRYISHGFMPYEDGLTLSIEKAGVVGTIRLQWRPESQAAIINEFYIYVNEVGD